MNLRQRHGLDGPDAPTAIAHAAPTLTAPHRERPSEPEPDRYLTLKQRIHRELIGMVDLALLERMEENERRIQVEHVARRLLTESEMRLGRHDEERIVGELMDDAFDFGPITPLLLDEEVSDILVNGHRRVYVERLGRLELAPVAFRDEAHLRRTIERVVSRGGRRIDESTPLVDARLADGSRLNAVIPPAALDGSVLSIRRFRRHALSIENLLEQGTLSNEMAWFLAAAVRARLNILVTGGTGSGKTTLLDVLSRFISNDERVVTIEDSAELMLQQPHVVRLETRPPNTDGTGQILPGDLLRNALRMRPDRILVGEVRGDEVLDLLQAMNSGHDGSVATIHSNGPHDALHRLENLVLMAVNTVAERAIREQIAAAIQLVVHVARLSDGSRKILSVQELVGMEGQAVTMQEIFHFVPTGAGAGESKVDGHFQATGIVPRSIDRLRLCGVELPLALFERERPRS
jgi:pilus assembly protein CpaF